MRHSAARFVPATPRALQEDPDRARTVIPARISAQFFQAGCGDEPRLYRRFATRFEVHINLLDLRLHAR